MKKLAIIGVAGYPSRSGGFDSFVNDLLEYNSIEKKLLVSVYVETSLKESHVTLDDQIEIIQLHRRAGIFGLLLHRTRAFLHARKSGVNNIYILGYVCFPVIFGIGKRRSLLITNMDGLEWKRSEYSLIKRLYLRLAEYCAVKKSDVLVSDSIGIQSYIKDKFAMVSTFIPYAVKNSGSILPLEAERILSKYSVAPKKFFLIVGRCVIENHILEIVSGFIASKSNKQMIIATDRRKNELRQSLKKMIKSDPRIVYMDPIYDELELSTLRQNCFAYIHGHSVGGTNPSLLESLTARRPIIAHRNIFNSEVLTDTAVYFESKEDIEKILNSEEMLQLTNEMIEKRQHLASHRYDIKKVYNSLFNLLR
jgi:glycosyltransferase involved in cell wall biosynthesis